MSDQTSVHVDRHLLIATRTTPARCCVAAGEFNGRRVFAEAVIDETIKGGDREKFKAGTQRDGGLTDVRIEGELRGLNWWRLCGGRRLAARGR